MIDFFYTYGLLIELLFVLLLFTYRLERKKYFLLKVLLGALLLAGFCLFRKSYIFDDVFIKIFFYLFLYLCCIIWGLFTFKSSFKSTVFCLIGGIIAQHLSYSVGDLTRYLLLQSGAISQLWCEIIYTIIEVIIDLFLFIIFCIPEDPKYIEKIQAGPIVGCSIALFIICIIALQYFEFYRSYFSLQAYILFIALDTTCCILTYMTQIISYLSARSTIETELVKSRLKQYEALQNVIDVMNIRLHDLKHQIRKLESENAINPDALKELTQTISSYRKFARVGNDALDAILTEKYIACEKESIKLTYNINGKLFDDFSISDINSIFGNAFDNAIEYLVTIPKENRFLTVRSSEVGQLCKIIFENTYLGTPTFNKDGLLNTTKDNTLYHGFGLKSIKNVIKKYHGNMTITVENKTFKLQILFKKNIKEENK